MQVKNQYSNGEHFDSKLQVQGALVEISANVVAFCRTMISKTGDCENYCVNSLTFVG